MTRSARRALQLTGTILAGTALLAALLIGHHRPGARLWTTAASITVTLAAQIRGKAITPSSVLDVLHGDRR